jgi:hypothetical protein
MLLDLVDEQVNRFGWAGVLVTNQALFLHCMPHV